MFVRNTPIIYMICVILLCIFAIIGTICLILAAKKKLNSRKTKKYINKFLLIDNICENEYATGDLLFFVSKDSEVIWLPYYLSHVGTIVKRDNKIYVLDADPLLTGKYLTELNEYKNKYCGHIYYVKMKWTGQELQNLSTNIQNILHDKLNVVEEAGVLDFINLLFNDHQSCTGLATKIMFNKENNLIIPDDLLVKLYAKIDYIKILKKENINNNCYHYYGLFNPFSSKHVIQK